jgi:EKC/KEOPS complex subunit PCC1/LAGE3
MRLLCLAGHVYKQSIVFGWTKDWKGTIWMIEILLDIKIGLQKKRRINCCVSGSEECLDLKQARGCVKDVVCHPLAVAMSNRPATTLSRFRTSKKNPPHVKLNNYASLSSCKKAPSKCHGNPDRSRVPLLAVRLNFPPPYFGILTRLARTIDLPLPTARLASAALQALRVDKELSPLVSRSFSTISTPSSHDPGDSSPMGSSQEKILRTEYKATTNRMLRVAVNGFMESLSVVLGVMEELDVDILGVEDPKE